MKYTLKNSTDRSLSFDILKKMPKRSTFNAVLLVPILAILVLITIALIFQFSAGTGTMRFFKPHLIKVVGALVVAFILSRFPKSFYRQISGPLYLASIALLVLVMLKGKTIKGAQRWLALGPINIEPSELLKVAIPLYLANFLSHLKLPISTAHLLAAGSIIIVPFLMIASQPDLGTAMLIGLIGLVQIFISGISYQTISLALCGLVASTPFLWGMLHAYQKKRILTILFPSDDVLGSGYHIWQSKIAIGSGGLWGKGLFNSSQVKYHFLPEFHTDFIFALIAEEGGLVICSLVILTFFILVASLFYLASRSTCQFSRIFTAGIAFFFFVCSAVNIAMVCGLLPVVGIPLPFISYGGSNLMVCGVALGITFAINGKNQ